MGDKAGVENSAVTITATDILAFNEGMMDTIKHDRKAALIKIESKSHFALAAQYSPSPCCFHMLLSKLRKPFSALLQLGMKLLHLQY